MMPQIIPAPGARIEVRDAEWLVRRVDRLSEKCWAVEALGISEVVRNKKSVFLTDIDEDMRVLDPAQTRLVADTSNSFQAAFLYMESLLRQTPPTDNYLYTGHRAAMDLNPFQLDPAIQALQQPRQRILIADTVGLGKTIEAGVLIAELIRRGRGKRILVVTAKSMLGQFQKELWARFTIPLTRLDSLGIQRLRRRLPTNQNPFHYHDKVIVSIDTLKQDDEYRVWLENTKWDIIVIDEAQNVAERGSGRSLRAKLAKLLSTCSDTLIMLSATPHDGRPKSFASLMNMLNPTAIANPEKYTPDDIKGLYIRRFKKDVADQVAQSFKQRKIATLNATAEKVEETLFEALVEVKFHRLDQRKVAGSMLFRTTLEKALFSSPAAFRETVRNRIRNLEKENDPAWASDLATLQNLDALAEKITPENFSKYQRLLRLLTHEKSEFAWRPTDPRDRLVIFTESLKTLAFLEEQLPAALGLKKGQLLCLDGAMADVDQIKIVEEFGREDSSVRLLLASDVASEGLNLHYLCHRLIHFDIPWSLMTFQQRNGRVDRYGQTEEPLILYLTTSSENPKIKGDTRILEILAEKDNFAAQNIGDPSALMGVYDINLEILKTGEAFENNVSPEVFASGLEAEEFNPLDLLLGELPQPVGKQAQDYCRQSLSLFADDFAYAKAALEFLKSQEKVGAVIRSEDRLIEIKPGTDLKVRFDPFPPEVLPEDGILRLTDDVSRIKKEIVRSRDKEDSWPHIQYLWPLHPAMEWINDRLAAAFRRHEAPIIEVAELLEPGERIYILSGLIPNRQGQPVIHRWVAVITRGRNITGVEPFEDIVQRLKLGKKMLPNQARDIDAVPLENILPEVVARAGAWISQRRQEFEAETKPRLNELISNLERLKKLQIVQLEESRALSQKRHEEQLRTINRTFENYQAWVKDSMTTEDAPFMQVMAVFKGGEE